MFKESIDPYLHVRYAKNPVYTPDGQKLSFIADYTGTPQVWELNRGEEWPAQISFTKERITFVGLVKGTSDRIIGMDVGGNENQQLFLLKEDGKLIELTKSPNHVHRYGGSSPDGKWIVWSSNRRNPAFFDIYIQSLVTLEYHPMLTGDGLFTAVEWSPDGKSLLVQKTNSPLDNDLGILDLATGSVDWITEHKGEASFREVHFNKDGDHIYVLTNKDSEFFGLALIHIKTKHFVWLEQGNWDFEELEMNSDKNLLAFSVNEGGVSKGVLLDINRSYLYSWKTPTGIIKDLKFSPDNKKLAYVFNGPAYPSDIWELDLESIQSERLTYVSRSPLLQDKLVEPELISYRSFDHLEIPAFFYKPKITTEKFPLVIVIHGGPESQSRAVYNPVVQYLIGKGYAVCTPNIRGSTGYGKTFTKLDDVRKRMDALKDIVFLVEWLKVNGNIDSNRIGIMGGSYGGFMVLAAISHYPQLWSAAIDIVGMSSLRTFLETTHPWRKKLREAEYGTIERDGDFFDKIDPLNHTSRITTPLLVIHGEGDPRVHIKESEQIVNKLKGKQHPVDFIRFDDEGHTISKLKNKEIAYKAIVDFLERCFGIEDKRSRGFKRSREYPFFFD
ncbi:S9 family peptidase [Neobacillus citreus]|uniref:S9 family peptidase n=1 Tax=Neobacillus citreus TaxID=2833578 RepID=A0A942T3Y8_9BACI|nr:S9 family peptidase [Neobacillus citreus]MCH6266393.1 S9 family peptidase [Neobacillus citreus]